LATIETIRQELPMSRYADKFGRAITRFVENPVTNLVKGIALVVIGLSDASKTLTADLVHGQFRVGHGLIIIGAFGILGALPHVIDGLAAGVRFKELRAKGSRTGNEPDKSDDQAN
jgi:hypothetical protein